jgi:hypothetical protein
MVIRIPILLDDKTVAGLVALAKQEYRDPRQQAAIIVYNELKRRGYLTEKLRTEKNTQTQKSYPPGTQKNE